MANSDVNELKSVLVDILKAVRGGRKDGKNSEGKYNKGLGSSNDLKKSYQELGNELKHQQEIIADSSISFKKLKEEVIKMFKPLASLHYAFEDTGKELKSTVKKQSDDYKEVSRKIYETFKDVVYSGKGFNSALKEMADGQHRFMAALEKAEILAKTPRIDKTKELEAQRTMMASQIASTTGSMRGKTDKEKLLLKQQLTDQRNKIKEINEAIAKEAQAHAEYTKNIINANKELEDAIKQLSIATGGEASLNKINVKNLKIGQATAKQFEDTRKQLQANSGASLEATEAAHQAITTFQKTKTESMINFIRTTGAAVIEKSIPQIIKDFEARQYYGANESMGTNSVITNTGMSEAERETLVGKNQALFRVMGNGDQNAAFRNKGGGTSNFLEMQKNLQVNFGMDRKTAAKELVEFGNTLMRTGFKPTEDNLKQFSDNLRVVADVTGEGPDIIKSFFDSMAQTGQMAIFQQALSGKTDKEREDIIQRNTGILVSLNKNLGYNTEELKAQNQKALQQKYAGLVQAIYAQVGRGMEVSAYNQAHPEAPTNENELALGRMSIGDKLSYAAGGASEDERRKRMNEVIKATKVTQNVGAAAIEEVNAGANTQIQAGNFNQAGVAGAQRGFGFEMARKIGGRTVEEDMQDFIAKNVAIGQGTQNVKDLETVMDSVIAGRFKGKDMAKLTAEAANKAADPFTQGLNESAVALQNFKSMLDTITGNPLGAPAAGVIGFAKEYMAMKAIDLVGGKGIGLAGRAIGSSAVGALGNTAAEVVGSTIPELMAGGAIAGIATITTAVLASAGVGAAIGTFANSLFDKTDYGKKFNDKNYATSSGPFEAALNKITAFIPPIAMANAMMAQPSQGDIDKLEAHKSGQNWLNNLTPDTLQSFGQNKFQDTQMSNLLVNGNITTDDLAKLVVSGKMSKEYADSVAETVLNNPTLLKLMMDNIQKIADNSKDTVENIKQGNEQDKEQAQRAEDRWATKEAIEARVNKFLRSDKEINKAINSSIPSGT